MLIGHSAGAHLCALTTLFLIDAKEELFIEASKQRDITLAMRGVIGKEHSAVHLQVSVTVATMFYAKENSTLINVCVCSELFLLL